MTPKTNKQNQIRYITLTYSQSGLQTHGEVIIRIKMTPKCSRLLRREQEREGERNLGGKKKKRNDVRLFVS